MNRAASRQLGAALIEFALTAILFFTVLFALIEFSRAMFAWNTSAEATRKAARLASVCSQGSESVIRENVQNFVEFSGHVDVTGNNSWLQMSAEPLNCNISNCTHIKVAINQETPLSLDLMIPTFGFSFNLPSHQAIVMRESMRSVISGVTNTECQ